MDNQITLTGPVTLTLKPETVALVLDCLAKTLPYMTAKPIIEDEIVPQLRAEDKTDVPG